MKRYLPLALAALCFTHVCLGAQAATLTYDIDFSKSKDLDRDTVEGMCGIPLVIQMDAKEDLATVVAKRVLGGGDIQKIEASSGSLAGAAEPYNGDYRTRVSIVKSDGGGYYKLGVFKRLEVTTYGSTSAPKAFEVAVELLNHRNSAELGEDMACANLAYKLR
jgi:hypothetical protein